MRTIPNSPSTPVWHDENPIVCVQCDETVDSEARWDEYNESANEGENGFHCSWSCYYRSVDEWRADAMIAAAEERGW